MIIARKPLTHTLPEGHPCQHKEEVVKLIAGGFITGGESTRSSKLYIAQFTIDSRG